VVLRSQAQAVYAAENFGHFGLNLRRYAHFTLADPALCRSRGASRLDPGRQARHRRAARIRPTAASLGEIGASISATERRSMAAERETADRLIAHFLADRVGATFEGRISGVTRAGLFREARRDRRRRICSGAHPRRRLFPLQRSQARDDRRRHRARR